MNKGISWAELKDRPFVDGLDNRLPKDSMTEFIEAVQEFWEAVNKND